jgi:hypothetical protein
LYIGFKFNKVKIIQNLKPIYILLIILLLPNLVLAMDDNWVSRLFVAGIFIVLPFYSLAAFLFVVLFLNRGKYKFFNILLITICICTILFSVTFLLLDPTFTDSSYIFKVWLIVILPYMFILYKAFKFSNL